MRLLFLCCILLQSTLLVAQNSFDFTNATLPEDLKENADSVIRDEQITINIPNQRTLEYSKYRVITVFNKRGMSDIDAYASYDKNSRIKTLEAIIYDENGNEIKKFKKNDFIDASAVDGGTLFSDSRVKYLDYTPVAYPFTIAFTTSWVSNDTAFIPFWFPNSTYESSTVKSSCTITYTSDLELKYKLLNPNDQIVIDESPGRLEVSVKNYKSFVPESYSLGFKNLVPKMIFALNKFHLSGVDGTATDWSSYGKWINEFLLKGTGELPQETRNEILKLVAGETDKIEKARKIYEYVQEKTRYISVQIGIGGWKPMLASEVDALGYGDCKALTNYTKSLLEVAEIPSYYTILYAGNDKRDIQTDLVSMQGNHAILSIPNGDDYVWLECTSQEIPFGFIGDFTDDRDVVVITPEGGKVVHTDVYDYSRNTQYLTGTCKVTSEGTLEAQVQMQSKGIQYDDRYLLENKIDSDQKKHYYNFWEHINNIKIDAIAIENNKIDVSMNEEVVFSAENYASFAGDEMLLSLNALNRYTSIPKRYKERNLDLHISRGFVDEDQVEVTIPDTYKLPETIENIVLESEFGSYNLTYEILNETTVKYTRKFSLYEGTYSKNKYKDFRSFIRKVVRYDGQKIALNKIK